MGDSLFFRIPNELQEDIGIDVAATVLAGEVQMRVGTAPRVAGNGNHLAGHDGSPPTNQHLGKVAIADGVISVPQGHILAGRLVLSHFDDHPLHHGQYLLAPCVQVDTAVKLPLSGKRVFPVAVW